MKFLADTAGRGGLRILAFAPGVGCSHMHNKCMKENEVSDASLSWAYGHLLHVHFPCVFLFGAAQIANDQWWITKRIAYIDGSASLAYHRLQPEQHRQTSTGQFTMSVTQLHCALAWISGFKRCKVAQTLWTLPIRCTILMMITIISVILVIIIVIINIVVIVVVIVVVIIIQSILILSWVASSNGGVASVVKSQHLLQHNHCYHHCLPPHMPRLR
jgi:hypothetical protein